MLPSWPPTAGNGNVQGITGLFPIADAGDVSQTATLTLALGPQPLPCADRAATLGSGASFNTGLGTPSPDGNNVTLWCRFTFPNGSAWLSWVPSATAANISLANLTSQLGISTNAAPVAVVDRLAVYSLSTRSAVCIVPALPPAALPLLASQSSLGPGTNGAGVAAHVSLLVLPSWGIQPVDGCCSPTTGGIPVSIPTTATGLAGTGLTTRMFMCFVLFVCLG